MKTALRALCFCWFVCLAQHPLSGQHIPDADSLLQRLPGLSGPEKVLALLDLCVAHLGQNKGKTIRYAKEALAEAERLKNDTLTIRSLNYLATAWLNHGEMPSCIAASERSIDLARKNNRPVALLDAMSNLASAYIRTYQNDKALQIANEGLALGRKENDLKAMVGFHEVIAEIQKDLKQWAAAEQTYKDELVLVEKLGRPFEKARAYNNMGLLYASVGKPAEAIRCFENAQRYFSELGYPLGVAVAQLNLADALLDHDAYPRAERIYADVLEQNKIFGDPEMEALALAGVGVSALSGGNRAKARTFLLQAEASARASGQLEVLQEVYHYLGMLSAAQGDFPAAWAYKRRGTECADSVASQNITRRVTELQVQYDTQKKEAEIAQQRARLLDQEAALFRQRTWLIALAAGALALAALGWLFHNRYRLRQKALLDAAVIREQKLGLNAVIEAQEAERRRIAKDLHDGIAQELVALKLGFTALRQRLGDGGEAERLHELTEQLDASCTGVRNIAHVMLPPALEQHGLAPSLELLLRNTAEQAGLRAQFDRGELPEQLDDKVAVGLYRITQELLNNVLKHARAAQVFLQLYTAGDQLVLRLEDDGVGFDFDSARRKGSMGILNILSRVGTLDGVFFTEPRAPRGTLATVRVPLKH